jgi:hypothetical protein
MNVEAASTTGHRGLGEHGGVSVRGRVRAADVVLRGHPPTVRRLQAGDVAREG